jgi:hypothetical protein
VTKLQTTSAKGLENPALRAQIKDVKRRVFEHMIRTRGWKYRVFLRYLRIFKYVAFAPVKGAFLEYYYVLMRYLDDIVDGDIPVPDRGLSAEEYLLEKIKFSKNPREPVDDVDVLMTHCLYLAKKMNEDFTFETADILGSLLFDVRRKGTQKVFSEEELQQHFHLLDIRGTIRATLKIFGEDPEKYVYLEALGTACRYEYDLEDLEGDLKAGYVNISQEEMASFELTSTDLLDLSGEKLKKWKIGRATEGLDLLNRHREEIKGKGFSLLSRATFYLVYEVPARRCFLKTLATHGEQSK